MSRLSLILSRLIACVLVASTLSTAAAQFQTPRTLLDIPPKEYVPDTRGKVPTVFTATDIDLDGDSDLLVAFGQAEIEVWENDGKGVFTVLTELGSTSFNALEIEAADLDGDGDQDVIAAVQQTFPFIPRVHYFENFGNGLFVDVTAGLLGKPTLDGDGVQLGDIDNDGDCDVLLRGGRVFRNDGLGRFFPDANLVPTASPDGIQRLLDVNTDGLVDFVDLDENGAVRLNDGTGDFAGATPIALPTSIFSLISPNAFDADNDGDLDLLLSRTQSNRIAALWINDGSGNFTENLTPPRAIDENISFLRRGSAALDADLDGHPDAVVLSFGTNAKLILQVQPGQFVVPKISALDVQSGSAAGVLVEDFNGSGAFDILSPANHFVNDGDGGFARNPTILGSDLPFSVDDIDVTDLGLDGTRDVAMLIDRIDTVIQLYRNDGAGNFTLAHELAPQALLPSEAIAAGELNGDGEIDIVVGQTSSFIAEQLILSQGPGSWGAPISLPVTLRTTDVDLGDLDGDGDLDIFITSLFSDSEVLINDGLGNFTVLPGTSFLGGGESTVLADLDGDGDLDVVTGVAFTSGPDVYENQGGGAFANVSDSWAPFGLPPTTGQVRAADWDNDGDIEITIPHREGVALLLNQRIEGSNTFVEAGAFAFGDIGESHDAQIRDVDRDGFEDIVVSSLLGVRVFLNNTVSHLKIPRLARLGEPFVVQDFLSYQPIAFLYEGIALFSPVRVPTVDTPFGRFSLDLATTVTLPLSLVIDQPFSQIGFVIPADNALAGMQMHWQGYSGPFGFISARLSPVRTETILF